jgi:nucleotide-binding universal stress UspA family protein
MEVMKVLLPIDASRASLEAVRHVCSIRRRGAEIEAVVLNVQPHFSRYIARFSSSAARKSLHAARSRAAVAEAIDELARAHVAFRLVVEVGPPAARIAEVAAREDVDEIVMGVGRHPEWLRWLNPSISRGVMARTDIPVMVLNRWRSGPRRPAHGRGVSGRPPQRPRKGGNTIVLKLLIPIDHSDASKLAIRHVIRRSWGSEALEAHLLHVLPSRDEDGIEVLEAAGALLERGGLPCVAHICYGSPADEIVRFAESDRFDGIVMASAGLGSITEMLLGSVAARVLRTSRVPVEIVPVSPRSKLRAYAGPAGVGASLGILLYRALD